jgi:8-amino-7-oxononanoate synthase
MFREELASLRKEGLYRQLSALETGQGPRISVHGREMISLASNDYLGLASHPKLKKAAAAAVNLYGTGTGASRLLSGTSPLHAALEEELAQFLECEAALIFNSGYAANTGTISALCQEEDLVISDALNHASIVDGCRLSRAKKHIYEHSNINMLEDILKASSKYRRKWIITDGVFSMDGDIAPLPAIAEVAEKYGAGIYLDEAHGIGVMGPQGRGVAAYFGLDEKVTLRMGTLGKAFGSFGAYVAGSREVIEYLINRARPFIFSTSLPPAVLAASRAALELIAGGEGDLLRERLARNLRTLSAGLVESGFLPKRHRTPIVPVLLGSVQKALSIADALYLRGIFAPAIRPPTVPQGSARVRLSVMATHSLGDMTQVARVLGNLLQGSETRA